MQVCSGFPSLAHAPFPYTGPQLIAVAAVANRKRFVGLISFVFIATLYTRLYTVCTPHSGCEDGGGK